MRLMSLRLAMAALVALALVTPLSAQALNSADPAPYVSSSYFHRAVFAPADAHLARLMQLGAVLHVEDYGTFSVAVLDERKAGGRDALLGMGLDLRDEQAVVGFNEWQLDTADAHTVDMALAQLPADLRSIPGQARDLKLVQFIGPIKDAWLDRLERTGARFVSYIANNAYIVATDAASEAALETFKADPAVQYVGYYHPFTRLSPDLRDDAMVGSGSRSVTIQVIDGIDAKEIVESLTQTYHVERETNHVLNYWNVSVVLPCNMLRVLAAHPSIFAIELRPMERMFDEAQGQIMAGNITGTSPNGPGYFAWLTSKGFQQTGQFAFAVDVTDDGVDRGSLTDVNDEFKVGGTAAGASRVVYNNNYTGDALADGGGGHGNVNASIIFGYNTLTGSAYEDASGYNYGLGICPFVQVGNTKVFSNGSAATFTGSTATRLNAAYNGGARISSNSWGYTSGNSYNSDSQSHDVAVRDAQSGVAGNQELTVVFAAGNDGSAANTVRPPATAKNIICVGASENVRQTGTDGCGVANSGANSLMDIIAFSSRGPCSDSRKKPDIMAPGTHIQGAASRSLSYNGTGVCNQYWPTGQTLYAWSSGTSHSTPGIAGACALVRQWFINQGWGTPSPAMVKAALMTTTSYMNGTGANDTLYSNNQGMGLVNLGRTFDGTATTRVDQSQVLGATGNTYTVTGSISSGSQPFRVGLVWTDKSGATTGNAWVNDLNLTVTINGTTTYLGNVFTAGASTTGGTAATRDNAEFVFLPAGTTGTFSITVTAFNIAGDGVPGNADTTDQDFALYVYNGSTVVTPGATLTPTPSTQSVNLGATATYTVNSAAQGGFAGNLTYSASPAITGVTYGFSPATVAVGSPTTFTAQTSGTTPAGAYTITITGTDGASVTSTTTVTLTVVAPDFSIGGTPVSQSVARGSTANFTVTNTPVGGFAGTIAYSASPTITGATFTFTPSSVGAGVNSVLAVATTAATPAGSYAITITGTSGAVSHTAVVALTVTIPDFTMAASPSSLTVAQGTSGTSTISTTATNGFSGTVALSASPALSGVTYGFAPASVAAGGSSVLTFTATGSATPGTFTVTVTGTSGALTHTATVTLTIAAPSFTLAATPATRSIVRGTSTTYTIASTPSGGFAGSISLSASPAIAGVTYAFATNPMAANGSSVLTVSTTTAAATGTYGIIVTGTSGSITKTATMTLTLTASAFQNVVTGAASPALAIPDNNATGVFSQINVTNAATIQNVSVSVNVTHTYIGDLKLTLTAPNGTTAAILHNQTGGSADNIVTTYAILTTPNQALTVFNGLSTVGNWKLTCADLAASDTGVLNSWRITFNGYKSVTPNLAIPDNNATGIVSTASYTVNGTVAAVKVKVQINHTFIGDLKVVLQAPDGTQVILHNRTGGATVNLNTEYPDLTVPAQSLNAFVGKSIFGNWALRVYDLAATDTGTLVNWQLAIEAQ